MKNETLGSFLHGASKKSNADLADSIRETKKITNKHDNVVIYQEKKTIDKMVDKLSTVIKCFDEKAELIIKTSKNKWKQD